MPKVWEIYPNLHVSRMWAGGDKERFPHCICPEMSCGYVLTDDKCSEHGFSAAKTIRSSHLEANCPHSDLIHQVRDAHREIT